MTEHSEARSLLWLPHVVAGAFLLFALNRRNPYSYYVLLRYVCCPIFAYLAFELGLLEKIGWTLMLGSQAVLYNPVFRVRLNRDAWSLLNIVSCILLGAAYFASREARARRERGRRGRGDSGAPDERQMPTDLEAVTWELDRAGRELANHFNSLGLESIRKGDFAEAIAKFQESLKALQDVEQTNADNLARVQASSSTGADLPSKLRDYIDSSAQQRWADISRVAYNLAAAFRKVQQDRDALFFAKVAVIHQPDSPLFRLALALDCELLGYLEEAIGHASLLEGAGFQEFARSILDNIAALGELGPGLTLDDESTQIRRDIAEKILILAERKLSWHAFFS